MVGEKSRCAWSGRSRQRLNTSRAASQSCQRAGRRRTKAQGHSESTAVLSHSASRITTARISARCDDSSVPSPLPAGGGRTSFFDIWGPGQFRAVVCASFLVQGVCFCPSFVSGPKLQVKLEVCAYMWLARVRHGVLQVATNANRRYVEPSGWERLSLLWTFRNFKILSPQVLTRRELHLVRTLCSRDSLPSPRGIDADAVIGTVELPSPPPKKAPTWQRPALHPPTPRAVGHS